MKRSDVERYRRGTAEYVVMHARWAASRGRRPSLSFFLQANPQKALAWAESMAYFPPSGSYLGGGTPEHYVCAECGASGCKLWRPYNSFDIHLLCAVCAGKDQKKGTSTIDERGTILSELGHNQRSDQIGWYIPAVPTEDEGMEAYWGYTSVPNAGCDWWAALPSLPPTPEKEAVAA